MIWKRINLWHWLDSNERAWMRTLDRQRQMQDTINELRGRVSALETQINEIATTDRVVHVETGPIVWPIPSANKTTGFTQMHATIRNTQPYGKNVDAIAQHTSVREGSD